MRPTGSALPEALPTWHGAASSVAKRLSFFQRYVPYRSLLLSRALPSAFLDGRHPSSGAILRTLAPAPASAPGGCDRGPLAESCRIQDRRACVFPRSALGYRSGSPESAFVAAESDSGP